MVVYHGGKVEYFCEMRHHFPFEECVPHIALVKVSSVDENDIFIRGLYVIHSLFQPRNASVAFTCL